MALIMEVRYKHIYIILYYSSVTSHLQVGISSNSQSKCLRSIANKLMLNCLLGTWELNISNLQDILPDLHYIIPKKNSLEAVGTIYRAPYKHFLISLELMILNFKPSTN